MAHLIQIALAFIEGIGLAFSPCILPILPLIFAASSVGGRLRPLQIVIGFILSFTLFSLISRQLILATGLHFDKIQTIGFILMLMIGFVMLLPILEDKFAKLTNSLANQAQKLTKNRFFEQSGGALMMGALIGIIWTPCAGPILAVALVQVIQSQTNWQAVLIIIAFSSGAGIPILLVGYLGNQLSKFAGNAIIFRQIMSLIIIVFALFGIFGFNLGEWVAQKTGNEEPVFIQNRLVNALRAPYQAPEITGIQEWINTTPLTLSSLKGKVVLLDFWTYSCINCIRTLPYLKDWYHKYKKEGLVVIGIHSPEFAFEQQLENVDNAVKKFGLTYPIALDNQLKTWINFNNHYWPAHYLINQQGQIVYIHLGEGEYGVTENNIRYLLNLDKKPTDFYSPLPIGYNQTPETYLGSERAQGESQSKELALHHWQLQGKWNRYPQYIENTEVGAQLILHYQAKKVFLVVENHQNQPGKIEVVGDTGQKSEFVIKDAKLYQLIDNANSKEGTIIIRALTPNLRFYTFTFES